MSDDVDKICRAVYYFASKAPTLEEALEGIRAVIGPKNVAEVDGILAQEKEKKK